MAEISYSFAMEAEQLLLDGKAEEALNLCIEGLQVFPEYPSAYGIQAKAYKELGDTRNALVVLADALMMFPNNKILLNLQNLIIEEQNAITGNENKDLAELTHTGELQSGSISYIDKPEQESDVQEHEIQEVTFSSELYTLDELFSGPDETLTSCSEPDSGIALDVEKEPQIESEISSSDNLLERKENQYDESEIENVMDSNDSESEPLVDSTKPELIPGLHNSYLKLVSNKSQIDSPTDILPDFPEFELAIEKESDAGDDILKLAVQLNDAKIPVVKESSAPEESEFDPEFLVISEFMAENYVKQNAYKEAIYVYEKLAVGTPEKAGYYKQIINDLAVITNT